MPGEDLSREGYVGFFGKLPLTGDFIERGLPNAFRVRWDAWVTHHLAVRREHWPPGGLRFRLVSGERTASGMVVPSHDAIGRRFPFTVLVVLPFAPATGEIDRWCDEALPLLDAVGSGTLGIEGLWQGLDTLPRPDRGDPDPEASLLLWIAGRAIQTADPADPQQALSALLSSEGSSPP